MPPKPNSRSSSTSQGTQSNTVSMAFSDDSSQGIGASEAGAIQDTEGSGVDVIRNPKNKGKRKSKSKSNSRQRYQPSQEFSMGLRPKEDNDLVAQVGLMNKLVSAEDRKAARKKAMTKAQRDAAPEVSPTPTTTQPSTNRDSEPPLVFFQRSSTAPAIPARFGPKIDRSLVLPTRSEEEMQGESSDGESSAPPAKKQYIRRAGKPPSKNSASVPSNNLNSPTAAAASGLLSLSSSSSSAGSSTKSQSASASSSSSSSSSSSDTNTLPRPELKASASAPPRLSSSSYYTPDELPRTVERIVAFMGRQNVITKGINVRIDGINKNIYEIMHPIQEMLEEQGAKIANLEQWAVQALQSARQSSTSSVGSTVSTNSSASTPSSTESEKNLTTSFVAKGNPAMWILMNSEMLHFKGRVEKIIAHFAKRISKLESTREPSPGLVTTRGTLHSQPMSQSSTNSRDSADSSIQPTLSSSSSSIPGQSNNTNSSGPTPDEFEQALNAQLTIQSIDTMLLNFAAAINNAVTIFDEREKQVQEQRLQQQQEMKEHSDKLLQREKEIESQQNQISQKQKEIETQQNQVLQSFKKLEEFQQHLTRTQQQLAEGQKQLAEAQNQQQQQQQQLFQQQVQQLHMAEAQRQILFQSAPVLRRAVLLANSLGQTLNPPAARPGASQAASSNSSAAPTSTAASTTTSTTASTAASTNATTTRGDTASTTAALPNPTL